MLSRRDMDVTHLRMQERRFKCQPGDSFLLKIESSFSPLMSCIHLTSGSCLLIHQIKREFTTSPSTCSVAALLYKSPRPSFCMRCFCLKHNNPHQNVFDNCLSQPGRFPPNSSTISSGNLNQVSAPPIPFPGESRQQQLGRQLSSTTAVSK